MGLCSSGHWVPLCVPPGRAVLRHRLHGAAAGLHPEPQLHRVSSSDHPHEEGWDAGHPHPGESRGGCEASISESAWAVWRELCTHCISFPVMGREVMPKKDIGPTPGCFLLDYAPISFA